MSPVAIELAQQAEAYPWFHSVELCDGVVTKGNKSLEIMRAEYENTFGRLDLKGKSVIDIGAWSGAFSVEACRRGASRVTAVDSYTWRSSYFRGREAFNLVVSNSGFSNKITPIDCNVDEPSLSIKHLGKHDVVLLLGVFYHLQDPIALVRQLPDITGEVLVLETEIDLGLPAEPPAMRFYPGAELAGDATNWWGPNISCVRDLLKMAGFSDVSVHDGASAGRKVFFATR